MSIERQAIAALKWTAGARLLGQLASWASTLLVLRLLAPEDYGLMAIVATLVGIVTAVAEFGLGAAMIQARELEREVFARLAGLVMLIHLGLMLLLMAAAPWLADWYQDERLRAMIQAAALQLLCSAMAAVPQAQAVRKMDFGWLARVELLTMVFGSLATLALAMHGAGAWALVGGMLATAAARTLLLVADGENLRPDFRLAGLGPHLGYSSRMATVQVLWSVVSQSDVIIGGRLLGRDALGLYSVALHLATLPMHKVMGVVNQVAFASVARLQDDGQRLARRIEQAVRLMAALAVGLMWGMAAVAPELVPVVIGPQWGAAVLILQLVSLVVPLRMLTMTLATAVGGVGAADVSLRNTLTAALVWPACFVVGAQWDALGLAVGWMVATPLTFALNARRIGRALGVSILRLLRLAGPPLVAGAAMLAAVAAARLGLEAHVGPGARLPLLIGVGALAYAATLLSIDRSLWADLRRIAASRSPAG